MDYPALRRENLAQALTSEGLDGLLLTNPLNVSYLTGFSGESSYLLLDRFRAVLVSDARFTEQLAEECPGLETVIRPPEKKLQNATAEVISQLGIRKIGFESGHLSVAEFEQFFGLLPAASWKAGSSRVETLRAIKDAGEVAAIREAIRIAERAFAMFRAALRPEDHEKDLHDALEFYVRRAGGKCTSFPSIVAVGSRAALPHAPPTKRRVEEAELLLVDWGASGPFYKSDLTRVLATRTLTPRLTEVYNVVLKAQEAAIRTVRPGVKGHEVDSAAREVLAAAGFGANFGHGLGHGIGLQVHEAPALRPNSEGVLQPGMVVTVEPGVYLPGWGGVRIEDDLLVTPDGCEVLSRLPKDLASSVCAW